MAVGQATLAAVITLDDQASAKLVNVQRSAISTGEAFRRSLPGLATFGSSLASLLITTGALNSETGRYVTIALSMASALASALPALRSLNAALATSVALQRAFSVTPIGLAVTAGALAIGATAGFAVSRSTGGPVVNNVNVHDNTVRSDDDLRAMIQGINRGVR